MDSTSIKSRVTEKNLNINALHHKSVNKWGRIGINRKWMKEETDVLFWRWCRWWGGNYFLFGSCRSRALMLLGMQKSRNAKVCINRFKARQDISVVKRGNLQCEVGAVAWWRCDLRRRRLTDSWSEKKQKEDAMNKSVIRLMDKLIIHSLRTLLMFITYITQSAYWNLKPNL